MKIIIMNKWLEILVGLILLIGAIVVAWFSGDWWGNFWNFGSAAWTVLKGGIFWIIIMVGALFILLGISDLKG